MTDFSNVGLRNHIQVDSNHTSQTVDAFKEANNNMRPDARFKLSGDGDNAKVEIRTGARVTRDRSMGISIRRFFSGLGTNILKKLGGSNANVVVNRDLRHAGYNLDKAVNNMVEMAANRKEVTDTQIEAHLQNIGKMKHALVNAEMKKGATLDEAMSKVDDRIKTNVKESMQAAMEAGKQNGKNIDDQVFKNVLSFGSHSWGAKHFTDASRNDRTAFAMKQKEYDGVIDEWDNKGNQKSAILDQQAGISAQSLLRAAADELRDETGFYFGKANNPEPQINADNVNNEDMVIFEDVVRVDKMDVPLKEELGKDINPKANYGEALSTVAEMRPGSNGWNQGVAKFADAFSPNQLKMMLERAADDKLPKAQGEVLKAALALAAQNEVPGIVNPGADDLNNSFEQNLGINFMVEDANMDNIVNEMEFERNHGVSINEDKREVFAKDKNDDIGPINTNDFEDEIEQLLDEMDDDNAINDELKKEAKAGPNELTTDFDGEFIDENVLDEEYEQRMNQNDHNDNYDVQNGYAQNNPKYNQDDEAFLNALHDKEWTNIDDDGENIGDEIVIDGDDETNNNLNDVQKNFNAAVSGFGKNLENNNDDNRKDSILSEDEGVYTGGNQYGKDLNDIVNDDFDEEMNVGQAQYRNDELNIDDLIDGMNTGATGGDNLGNVNAPFDEDVEIINVKNDEGIFTDGIDADIDDINDIDGDKVTIGDEMDDDNVPEAPAAPNYFAQTNRNKDAEIDDGKIGAPPPPPVFMDDGLNDIEGNETMVDDNDDIVDDGGIDTGDFIEIDEDNDNNNNDVNKL